MNIQKSEQSTLFPFILTISGESSSLWSTPDRPEEGLSKVAIYQLLAERLLKIPPSTVNLLSQGY